MLTAEIRQQDEAGDVRRGFGAGVGTGPRSGKDRSRSPMPSARNRSPSVEGSAVTVTKCAAKCGELMVRLLRVMLIERQEQRQGPLQLVELCSEFEYRRGISFDTHQWGDNDIQFLRRYPECFVIEQDR